MDWQMQALEEADPSANSHHVPSTLMEMLDHVTGQERQAHRWSTGQREHSRARVSAILATALAGASIAAGIGFSELASGSADRHPLALTSSAATDACTSSSDGYWVGAEAITAENATLAGAYTTSAGEIGSWMTTLPGSPPNRFAADASSQTIYVCYFAGTFPGIGSGVKPAGQTYGTMLVAIPVGGTAQLLLYGPATDSLSFDPPGNG